MITVTIVARGRRQVLFFIERFGMDAGFVLRILVAGNSKPAHIVSAGMTLRARLSDIRRIDRRQRIFWRSDAVNTVTTYTSGDALLARLQQFAVIAGVVLFFLIDPQ